MFLINKIYYRIIKRNNVSEVLNRQPTVRVLHLSIYLVALQM